jgi:uncharacterized membrane protein SpoIIM required for sporulation
MKRDMAQVWLVASRELRDQLRDWRILFPLIVLTVFFPYLMNITAQAAVNFVNRYNASLIAERMIPFLLMVVGFFPVTVALVVALETFVGEKERGTIEPLLSSPLSDWQLYLGKLFASTIIPLAAAYIGITVYLFGLSRGGVKIPDVNILIQTIVLTAVQAVLMVSGAMLISAQSTSVRAANLLASFVIIPVALLVQGESVLMFWGNDRTLWLAVIGVCVLSGLLIRLGLAHFKRESLIGREIDMLNFRWMGQTFKSRFIGKANSIIDWYKDEIPATLKKLRFSILVTLVLGIAGVLFAYYWTKAQAPLYINNIAPGDVKKIVGQLEQALQLNVPNLSFGYIFLHNLQAILVAMLIGFASFGIGGMVVFLINAGVIGGVLGIANVIGFSPLGVFAVGILPHGIFELSAVILTSAAVLHMGVTLVTPDSNLTIGQVFIETFADWLKILVGLALPLLVLAALIETYITPLIIAYFI